MICWWLIWWKWMTDTIIAAVIANLAIFPEAMGKFKGNDNTLKQESRKLIIPFVLFVVWMVGSCLASLAFLVTGLVEFWVMALISSLRSASVSWITSSVFPGCSVIIFTRNDLLSSSLASAVHHSACCSDCNFCTWKKLMFSFVLFCFLGWRRSWC